MSKVKQIKAKALAARSNVTGKAGRGTTARVKAATPPDAGRKRGGGRTERNAVPGRNGANGRPDATRKSGKRGSERRDRGRATAASAGAPEITVRELVPEKVCGPRTRVQQVFRVEERMNGSSQMHLVFNDRHGWYCEHGTDCPAVGAVRKSGKTEAARNSAWTTNGRMRE